MSECRRCEEFADLAYHMIAGLIGSGMDAMAKAVVLDIARNRACEDCSNAGRLDRVNRASCRGVCPVAEDAAGCEHRAEHASAAQGEHSTARHEVRNEQHRLACDECGFVVFTPRWDGFPWLKVRRPCFVSACAGFFQFCQDGKDG